MSTAPEPADRQQQKMREFMSLLPLTLAVAGLSEAPQGSHLSEGQMESRAMTIKAAYKVARQIILDVAK
jgi:hypothetical protein